jgi:proteasome lid subunit RPN8/RPN11
MREFARRGARLRCSRKTWNRCLKELRAKGDGRRESGAFLLGIRHQTYSEIIQPIYYEDLEPESLSTGIVTMTGHGYGALWRTCVETGLVVVADVHTHPGTAVQSATDSANPMIAISGHISLIVPFFARYSSKPRSLGIYEYEGSHRWLDWSGERADKFFYVGLWG